MLPFYPKVLEEILSKLSVASGRTIAIDGNNCVGKTNLARWLSFHLGCSLIEVDLFKKTDEFDYFYDEIERLIVSEVGKNNRWIIVDSVAVGWIFKKLGRRYDFRVYVKNTHSSDTIVDRTDKLGDRLSLYHKEFLPEERADFVIDSKLDISGSS